MNAFSFGQKLHFLNQSNLAHFHLYQNSKYSKLDSALPCYKPSSLSILHPLSMCTHSPAYPCHS